MSQASLAQLQSVSLFQSLNEAGLRALAERAKRRSLGAGHPVFKEGEPADSYRPGSAAPASPSGCGPT